MLTDLGQMLCVYIDTSWLVMPVRQTLRFPAVNLLRVTTGQQWLTRKHNGQSRASQSRGRCRSIAREFFCEVCRCQLLSHVSGGVYCPVNRTNSVSHVGLVPRSKSPSDTGSDTGNYCSCAHLKYWDTDCIWLQYKQKHGCMINIVPGFNFERKAFK